MKTAVVILNWNTRGYLERFLPPLLDSIKGMDASVVVADNASTDGSADLVEESFPGVRIIRLDGNYGFTGGYDRALAQVDAEYYVLLNSDVEVPSGWLEPLVGWMEEHARCGACAPKLLSLNERGSFEYAGAAGGMVDRWGFPYCRGRVLSCIEKDEGQYDTPAKVLWGSGACLMVRSSVWKELGGLDGRFFAHMEEIDLCWRMQLAGWEVWSVPQSEVYHLGGGTLPQGSPWKLELNFRNSLLMREDCLPQTVGLCRARCRIGFRMFLDRAIQAALFVSGRKEEAGAVGRAHAAFRKMRRGLPKEGARRKVAGYGGGKIVIFEYIRRKLSLL